MQNIIDKTIFWKVAYCKIFQYKGKKNCCFKTPSVKLFSQNNVYCVEYGKTHGGQSMFGAYA